MDTDKLLHLATVMMDRAYTPYSHFHVGAALLGKNQKIYGGCNIENASYGLTNCAERSAVFSAIVDGEQEFQALLITGDTEDVITPCGACRQVLNEFCAPDMPVYLTNQTGKIMQVTVEQLLPGAFDTDSLSKTK